MICCHCMLQEPKFLLKPVVPPYNPLDKADKKPPQTKTKTLPYSKDVVISTEGKYEGYLVILFFKPNIWQILGHYKKVAFEVLILNRLRYCSMLGEET